jgi:hypothetical protein
MKRLVAACVVVLSMCVSPALAQDTGGMPPPPTPDQVGMQMGMPAGGPNIQINMEVHETREVHEGHGHRMEVHEAHEQRSRSWGDPAPQLQDAFRDCGTGNDPGCTMTRRGHLPMDADEFQGLLQALRSNVNELERQDMIKSALGDSFVTAKQLGKLLDLFQNAGLRGPAGHRLGWASVELRTGLPPWCPGRASLLTRRR